MVGLYETFEGQLPVSLLSGDEDESLRPERITNRQVKMHSERSPRSPMREERANPKWNPEFLTFQDLPAFGDDLKMHSERNPRSLLRGASMRKED